MKVIPNLFTAATLAAQILAASSLFVVVRAQEADGDRPSSTTAKSSEAPRVRYFDGRSNPTPVPSSYLNSTLAASLKFDVADGFASRNQSWK